jgi:hypothetical protein
VESEALDAVRLMTIHRAKGLEFEIVCVADLGRGPRYVGDLLRVGRDGRIGLQIARPGTGQRESALDLEALRKERFEAEAREERRLFYVAMTRARERLILSGAARFERWQDGATGGPIAWIGPALVPEIAVLGAPASDSGSGAASGVVRGVVERAEGPFRARIGWAVARPEGSEGVSGRGSGAEGDLAAREGDRGRSRVDIGAQNGSGAAEPGESPGVEALPPPPPPPAAPAAPVSALSYSSLGEYARCGYRFYLERVLRLPPVAEAGAASGPGGLSGAERGVVIHALLEGIDFKRPIRPTAAMIATAAAGAGLTPSPEETEELADQVEAFARSPIRDRLAKASDVRREERFAFLLHPGSEAERPPAGAVAPAPVLVTGFLDVVARERGQGADTAAATMLVVDYKSDRLDGADPEATVASAYGTQRLIYALAALEAGAEAVEVAHVFLEAPERPVAARFDRTDIAALRDELAGLAAGVLARDFEVTDAPHRSLCHGCPGEGGLCSWPLSVTRREDPDQLF